MQDAKDPSWMKEAKKHNGKNENDSKWRAVIVPFWVKLYKLNFKTIVGTSFAWCGLFVGMCLYQGDMPVQSRGAAAVSWMNYGQAIDWKRQGIPYGAVIEVNHAMLCGNSKNNHVAFANGDCAASDLVETVNGKLVVRKGAMIDLYGGNQGNMVKRSTFAANTICAVRWPSNYPTRGMITQSKNCASKMLPAKESTR